MSQTNPWLEDLCNLGAAACEGLLAARATAREGRRAATDDAAVPPTWRARSPGDRGVPDLGGIAPAKAAEAGATPSREPRIPSPPPPLQKVELVLNPFAPPWQVAGPPAAPAYRPPPRQSSPTVSPEPIKQGPAPTSRPEAAETTATSPSPPASQREPTAGDFSPQGASAAASSPGPVSTAAEPAPQMELDFSPRPAPPASAPPQETTRPADTSAVSTVRIGAILDTVVRLLDDVIGHNITEALTRMEQAHSRELTALTQVFESLFERQEARHRELLERQDMRLQEILDRQARNHADELRTILQETSAQRSAVPTTPLPTDDPTALAELQETLRLGFGEVRASLDRHHHELMNAVRSDLRPLAQAALARLCAPEPPRPDLPVEPAVPAPQPRPRAGPARPAPTRDELESSSRRRHAALDDDDEDGDEAYEDCEDSRRRGLHYPRPDDSDAELSSRQEAGP